MVLEYIPGKLNNAHFCIAHDIPTVGDHIVANVQALPDDLDSVVLAILIDVLVLAGFVPYIFKQDHLRTTGYPVPGPP